MISAKIIADSQNECGNRITSFVVVMPRIVLAELNTHRMLSRNSASSRAIPFEKMLQRVEDDPFIPIRWMKDHSGMQGNEYFEDNESIIELTGNWLLARSAAINQAIILSEVGATKQIVNRLLEPFMWHTAIITATEFENFFALRAHEAAEIHLQNLAYKMLDAMNNSIPKQLSAGEWHIPFGDKFDENRLNEMYVFNKDSGGEAQFSHASFDLTDLKVRISTARCARVSYMNFEGKDDYEADIKLHDRLLSSGHMSPFEHCAKAMSEKEYYHQEDPRFRIAGDLAGWSGNFRGFTQYRKMLQEENKKDSRLKK